MVADATDIIYEVEATTAGASFAFSAADVGTNANLYAGAGSTATGNSAYSLDMADSGTTATLPFKIVGVSQRPDNAMATTAVKVLVQLNNSQFKGGTGTAGV